MTDHDDLSAAGGAMTPPDADNSAEAQGSRVEAAAAGLHHERAEAAEGLPPQEHVTAAHAIAHHHPEDPNAGIVRGRLGRGALLAAGIATAVTVAGVVLLALAIGGPH